MGPTLELKRLELAFNILVAIVVLAIALGAFWMWRERARIYQDVVSTLEARAGEALGLPVEIGGIEGLWWKDLVLRDVKIRGYPGESAPVVVYLPRVQANYSIAEILKLGKKPVEVVVTRPVVTLERDAAGQLNVRPAKRPAGEPGEPPRVPIHIRIREGSVSWLDAFQATSSQVVPFHRSIRLGMADVTVRDGEVRFLAQARDADAQIRLRGRHDMVRGSGDASVQANALSIADWAGYAAPSDDYRILRGRADVVAKVRYALEHRGPPDVRGQVWIADLVMEHKDVLAPVEKVGAWAEFDLKQVHLKSLTATVIGNTFTGSGTVDIRNPADPLLDLRISLPRVDLASARHIVPELTPFGISGTASGQARVHGSARDPVVEVEAAIGNAVALKEKLGPGSANIRFHHMKAEVSNLELAIHGGKATGSVWFTTDSHPAAGGRIAFQGVQIGPAAAPYLPRPLPIRGRASGTAEISGPMDAIRIAGSIAIADAAFGRQPVESGRASFLIHRGNVTVSDIDLTVPDGGRIAGQVGWDDGGDLVMELVGENVDLGSLRRAGLDVDLAGRASASVHAAGNMAEPDTLEIAGRIEAGPGEAYGQPVQDVAGDFSLVAGRLVLSNVVGHAAGGRIAGRGVVGPLSFERDLPPPDVRLAFEIAGADLSRITAVAEAAREPLGGLKGRASARAVELSVHRGKLRVAGTLDATDLDAPRIGEAAAVGGEFVLDGGRLTLRDVQVARGATSLGISGDVVLGENPALSLRIRTADADVRTLLGAVHWRRLLQGTWMLRRAEEVTPGEPRPFAELPDREAFEYDPSQVFDLSALYNHWLGVSATPSVVTEEHIKAARPFWESIDGTLDAEIRLDGTARSPEIFAQADLRGGKAYGHALSTASMLAWFGRGELTIDHMVVEATEGGRVAVNGALGNGRSLEIAARDLDLSWINPFLPGQDLTLAGMAAGTIVATGTLEKPRLAISATAERGQISDFLYDSAMARASFEGGLLDIEEVALVKDGKEARVTGTLPIGLRPEDTELNLTLDVRGTGLGIVSVLSKGLIDWRGGDGQLRVDIIGTQAAPRLRGALKLQDARVAVKTLTGEISDIDAVAQVGAGIVKIERATASYGGGRLEATGFITMKQFKFDSYLLDLWATPLNLVLPNGMFDGTVDGHLGIGGKFERPSVTGEITVSKGTLSLAAQTPGGGGPQDGGTPIDLSGLNLNIKDQVTVVQPNLMNLRVFGNLVVSGTVMQPDFKGVIHVVPGGKITTFYTNEFTVEEGRVEFLGGGRPDEESELVKEFLPEDRQRQAVAMAVPNARVYVVATGTTTDYDRLHDSEATSATGTESVRPPKVVKVKATITGTLTDLRYTFQSDPPEYSQSEIETLLGKPSLVTGVITKGTGGISEIAREVGPAALNFLLRQSLNPLVDPLVGRYLRDYSLDLVSDPTRAGILTGMPGFNVAVSAETRPLIGPLSFSYRRVINPSEAHKDLKRYGLNLGSIPINARISNAWLDWLSHGVVVQDLTLGGFIEDFGGGGELPGGIDLGLPGSLTPVATNELSIFRRSDPWRWSIQVGIRGRL